MWVGKNFRAQLVHPPHPIEEQDWPQVLESGCLTPVQWQRPLGGTELIWVSVKPGGIHKGPASKMVVRASLVAQWLRIHLPMQGTWVRALVREDSHVPWSN